MQHWPNFNTHGKPVTPAVVSITRAPLMHAASMPKLIRCMPPARVAGKAGNAMRQYRRGWIVGNGRRPMRRRKRGMAKQAPKAMWWKHCARKRRRQASVYFQGRVTRHSGDKPCRWPWMHKRKQPMPFIQRCRLNSVCTQDYSPHSTMIVRGLMSRYSRPKAVAW